MHSSGPRCCLCLIDGQILIVIQFFDTLLLLQNGGQTVYFGDLGLHSKTLLQYFERHGARECRPEENPYAHFSFHSFFVN